MDEALITFLETGVDADQLERIKMQFRASETYARDDAGGLAQRYGQALTQGLTVADVQAWPALIQATTAEEIMQAARDVLDRTQSVTGWLMAPEVTQ